MKKYFSIVFFLPLYCFAQVGINTINPNAQLDIQSSNVAAPANTDGILIPKIDEYPATNPTGQQDGMLVYATGNGSVSKGFYYWDNTASSWIAFAGVTIEKIDDLLDGKSDNDGTDNGSSIFLGVNAGANDNSSDNRSVAIGFNALQSSVNAFANTAIGYQTLSNSTAGSNTAIGYEALSSNISGSQNTAIGRAGLFNNNDGLGNVAVGYGASFNNTSGDYNTAIGRLTLYNNTSGSNNTAIGYDAMYFNETGTDNVAVGGFALRNNISGDYNSAFGYRSLEDNATGFRNSAFGISTLESNVSGAYNSAYGDSALYSNTTGNRNSAFGEDALYSNTTGDGNTVIGAQAGYNNNGSRNVFIGYSAGFHETGNQRLFIDVIGTASPLIYGEFDTDFLRINGDFEVEKTTNASTTVVTPFGFQSSLKLFERGGSGDFGFEFQYDGSPDKLYLWSRTFAGNEGIRMTWLKDGRVGMNDTAPDARLDIEAINQVTPTNTDGLLIPRIDAFPVSNPGAAQNGMLVFLTSDNSFYFWNNANTTWQKVNRIECINDLIDGKSDNDGSDNGSSIFIGLNAGTNDNETDNDNVGVGYYALHFNTSGSANTAVGSTALISNTSGSNNSAFGRRALYWSTTGSGNSAFGSQALEANTTGYSNTAVSYEALTSNTTGYHNTAIGYEALESNTIGNFNTALGYEALSSSTDTDSNTAMGYTALRNNTTGFFNTAVGYEALRNNTIGYRNTAVGFEAMRNNTSGLYNSGIGLETLENNTTGNYNTAVGHGALPDNTTGNSNTAIGNSTSLNNNFSNTVALGYNADPSGSNQVRIGNAGIAMIGGFANWQLFSDGRIKTNVQEDIVGLEFIKKLRPVSYNYDMDAIARFEQTPDSLRLRDAERLKAQEVQTGFIAQEVEAAAEAVGFDFHGIVKPYDANGTYALRYAEFVVPLVKAMQEQQDMIEAQQEEIDTLRSEIEQIKLLLKRE